MFEGLTSPFTPTIHVVATNNVRYARTGVFSHRGNTPDQDNFDSGGMGGVWVQHEYNEPDTGVYFAPTGYWREGITVYQKG